MFFMKNSMKVKKFNGFVYFTFKAVSNHIMSEKRLIWMEKRNKTDINFIYLTALQH